MSLTNSVGSIFTLHIPTNALFSPTLISMTEVRDTSSFPFAVGAAEGVEFRPKGLLLLDAATVTVKLAEAPGTRKVTGFAYCSDGSDFRLIPAEAADNTLTMGVFSLAGCGVSFITADELQAQELRRPLDLSAAGEQADALFSLGASPLIRARGGNARCDSPRGRIINRMDFYKNIFDQSRESTCDSLVSDWAKFTTFRRRIIRGGCATALADELNYIGSLITEITSGVRVKRCIEEKIHECQVGCRGGAVSIKPFPIIRWHLAFTENHRKENYFGEGYDYVFGSWNFHEENPWADWKAEKSPRKITVAGIRLEDTTTLKLYHTPQ